MAGVSTGVNLLPVNQRLIDSMADFWEFTGGSFTSYRGRSAQTNGATTTAGVDGDANGAVLYNGSANEYVYLHNLNGSTTIVCWCSAFNPTAIIWGDEGNNTTSSGYRAGYRIDNKTFVNKESGTPAVSFSLPAHTLSTGSGYNFLALNFTTNTYPSQTLTLYSGSGEIIMQSTQDFGAINTSTSRLRLVTWGSPVFTDNGRFDKICSFNRPLTAAEISFLYNSGNGRVVSEIEGFH